MKENIEEDMKMLERIDVKFFLTGTVEQSDYVVDKADEVNNAISNILSDYKRVLKENEVAKEALKKQCDIADERNQLLKENEELKEEYKNAQACANMVFDKVIPVKKVKDKIEEYSKIEKEMHENKNHSNDINKVYKYSVEEDKAKYRKLSLQELLEEKGE